MLSLLSIDCALFRKEISLLKSFNRPAKFFNAAARSDRRPADTAVSLKGAPTGPGRFIFRPLPRTYLFSPCSER